MANPQSTARIAGHPIHPMLIPFPIAFFVGTFACDVAYWITGNANWAMVTPWLLGAGIIMGALAALAGLTDVIGEQRIRALNDVWLHAGGMVIVILIEIYNWYARYTEGAAAILPKVLPFRWWLFASCCSPAGWAGTWFIAIALGSPMRWSLCSHPRRNEGRHKLEKETQ